MCVFMLFLIVIRAFNHTVLTHWKPCTHTHRTTPSPPAWGATLPLPNSGTTPPPTTGCLDGFSGVNCHACEEATYSSECTKECVAIFHCSDNGRCRGKDGTCICFEGWTGANCSVQVCHALYYYNIHFWHMIIICVFGIIPRVLIDPFGGESYVF
jgi:hypothetical protein